MFHHAFFAPEPAQTASYEDCRAGLRGLHQAIVQGRAAARAVADPDVLQAGDEQALRRYREVVAPAWRHRDQVAHLCRADPELKGALDTIERLRYSEEHAVRSQAVELTALRRRVRRIVVHSLNDRPTP